MRLLRLDGAGPGGEDLEFHPRLTVLAGAPASVVARLVAVLRALGGDVTEADPGARVAVGGVSFPVDGVSLAALRPSVGAASSAARTLPAGPAADLVVDLSAFAAPLRPASVTDRSRDLVSELAEAEATVELLEREVAERGRALDAFAPAAQEAARRRVDAARRAVAAASGDTPGRPGAPDGGGEGETGGGDDGDTDGHTDGDTELEARIAELELLGGSLAAPADPGVDPASVAAVDAALAELEAETGRPPGTDPAAADLAERLEAAWAAAMRRRARRRALAQLAGAAADLANATRRELRAAEVAAAAAAERAPVRAALDAVRVRIVELAEAGPEPEARGELSELRAEEAELLDRLGADTYAELVLRPPDAPGGSPEVLRARFELLEQEAGALQRRLEDADRDERHAAAGRDVLVGEAAGLLGAVPSDLARLTSRELAELLRRRPDTAGRAAAVGAAAAGLGRALAAAGARPEVDDPDALVAAALRWQEEEAHRRARAVAVAERRAEVEAELVALRARLAASPSARSRAELREAEAELARADARAERAAARRAELAEVRADLEAARAQLAGRRAEARDADRVAAAVADATADLSTVTWAVLERIASVRRAAADGGMPLLLTGLDVTLAPEVLAAVAGVLDEVQLVVAGSPEMAGALAAGADATVLRWP